MRFRGKFLLLCLLTLFLIAGIKAQESSSLPFPPTINNDEEFNCGLRDPELIQFKVTIESSKKGYLKNLTYEDFEIYDEEALQIEFFKFDEVTNQYLIAFIQPDFITDKKWRDVKIKIKLSAEKRKEYGKIIVRGQKGYYPVRN